MKNVGLRLRFLSLSLNLEHLGHYQLVRFHQLPSSFLSFA